MAFDWFLGIALFLLLLSGFCLIVNICSGGTYTESRNRIRDLAFSTGLFALLSLIVILLRVKYNV